jgi:hypothetical protein
MPVSINKKYPPSLKNFVIVNIKVLDYNAWTIYNLIISIELFHLEGNLLLLVCP